MMVTNKLRFLVLLAILCGIPISNFAQISEGGTPYSFQTKLSQPIISINLPKLDMEKVRKEDENLAFTRQAIGVELNINPNTAGQWTDLPMGDRLWQLSIKSEDALFLTLVSTDFFIPKGGKLFIFDKSHKQVLGAYTNKSNNNLNSFSSQEIKSNEMIIEYFEPNEVKGQSRISIDRVFVGYKLIDFEITNKEKQYLYNSVQGFGDADNCHVEAQCDDYDIWDEQRRSVARIWITSTTGGGWCSGSLINNTNNDETPYFLSAWHCQAGGTQIYSTWRFDFEYEHPNCSNGAEPTANSVTGATELVKSDASDVLLLQLSSLPAGSNHYLAGWNRENVAATSVFGFHHPRGDVKKASKSNSSAFSNNSPITFGGLSLPLTIPTGNLWGCIWDEGTTEEGSSGSPLFDNNKRIVGQLTGGNSGCDNLNGNNWYGKLSASWNFVQPYLDPNNSGVLNIDGFDGTISLANNVRVREINVNTSPCLFTTSTQVEVVVQNFGQNPQTAIPVSLEDELGNNLGNTIITSTLNTSESTTVIFNVDMFNRGEYILTARTNLPGDENPSDDQVEETFTNSKATIGASNVQITGADMNDGFTITWERGNGESVIVLVKEGSDFTSVDFPLDGEPAPSASNIFGVTPVNQANGGKAFAVYRGFGTSVHVEKLTKDSTYYVAVIEYSCNPADYLLESPIYDFETVTNLEDDLSSQINIYPNPSSEFINIDWGNIDFDNANITLHTTTGRKVRDIFVKNKEITKMNISDLNKGMYIIQFKIGEKGFRKKIIVE